MQIDLDLILHRRILERAGRLRGKVVSHDYFGANLVSRYAFVRPQESFKAHSNRTENCEILSEDCPPSLTHYGDMYNE